MSLLRIRELCVDFSTADGPVHAVRNVSLDLESGEILAIVGESGSGKSQTAFATMGLLPANARCSGSVCFDGKEILGLDDDALSGIRAREIAMIFQNPMTSLNPYRRISDQMTEVLKAHQGLSSKAASVQCIAMLESMNISDAEMRFKQFPHECSGGMRQRIMIAMSLLCRPRILVADEPTTALDVTIQAQIIDLLKMVRERYGMAIILITHDMGLVANCSDRVAVMYAGRVMESGPTEELFLSPQHPYTDGLLKSVIRMDEEPSELYSIPGSPPDTSDAVSGGCPFSPRCPASMAACSVSFPSVRTDGGRSWSCFRGQEGS